ncbi:MAG: MauE/DoxX family redox-associated membrane protein [Anaerolineales bacterium]|nr:MauE/DoxX family redox-associated membrane protein [Anaerolineales bacterium]
MSETLLFYALTFSRLALALVFAASSLGKLRDFPAFERAVRDFRVLPGRLVRPGAYLFLASEIAVVALMLAGAGLLWPGFLLAIVLLSLFSLALVMVLLRGIETACACFGSSRRPVSPADVGRNVGFLACAVVGLGSLSALSDAPVNVGPAEIGLLGMMALVCVAFLVYLGEVLAAFRSV